MHSSGVETKTNLAFAAESLWGPVTLGVPLTRGTTARLGLLLIFASMRGMFTRREKSVTVTVRAARLIIESGSLHELDSRQLKP